MDPGFPPWKRKCTVKTINAITIYLYVYIAKSVQSSSKKQHTLNN